MQHVMPFRIIARPGADSCMFITSRPEKTVKYPHKAFKANLPEALSERTSVFTSTNTFSSKILLTDTNSCSYSPSFEDNMARISNLRYHTRSAMKFPPIRKNLEYRDLPNPFESTEEVEKEESSVVQLRHQIGYWRILDCEGTTPRCCESAQIIVIDTILVICGGQSQVKHCDIKTLDFRSYLWKSLKTQHTPPGRLGHSIVNYKHKVIVFGGWNNTKTLERHTTGKLFYLSLHTNNWEKVQCEEFSPTPRKYHAAAQLGKNMLVFGGIDYLSELKFDLFLLNIKEKTWSIPEVYNASLPGGRSHCTLTPVFHQKLKSLYNYSIEKIPRLKDEFSLQNSAFYLFGGMTANKTPCNNLHALFIRSGKMAWSEINCMGLPPCPRYSHSAYAIHSSLFIYGGRNDIVSGRSQTALSDLFVLNVMTFKWEKVDVFGHVPQGRWAHGMAAYGTSLVLFGGISYKEFMKPDLFMLETERLEVEKRIQNEKKN